MPPMCWAVLGAEDAVLIKNMLFFFLECKLHKRTDKVSVLME